MEIVKTISVSSVNSHCHQDRDPYDIQRIKSGYYITYICTLARATFSSFCSSKIRRPASALLDKLLCLPGPGGPAATG